MRELTGSLVKLNQQLQSFRDRIKEVGLTGPVLVSVNGRLDRELSDLREIEENLKVEVEGAFSVDIPKGAKIASPLWAFYWSQSESEAQLESKSKKIHVRVGAGSEFSLVQYFAGEPSDSGQRSKNSLKPSHYSFETQVDQGARLQVVQILEPPTGVKQLVQSQGEVARDGYLEEFVLSKGLGGSQVESSVDLNGENSEAQLNSLCVGENDQTFDQYSLVRHHSPQTRSGQVSKGVLGGQSQASFNGKIYIALDAQMVESFQMNKNLLLSRNARVHSKPELEVHADNVKANHGSATGQLSAEQLFYLTSRGIEPGTARHLLIDGFTKELVERMSDVGLRQWVYSQLNRDLL